MHGRIDDHVLIAHLAVQCTDGTLKSLMSVYMESTRDDRVNRNSQSLLKVLDRELARTGQEIAVNKMHLWSRTERRTTQRV